MRIEQYERAVQSTDQTSAIDGHRVRIYGLAGEIGSLLTELKKDIREGTASANKADRVAEEIGDILWYVTALALHARLKLKRDVLFRNLVKVRDLSSSPGATPAPMAKAALRSGGEVASRLDRLGVGVANTFDAYQSLAVKTSRYKKWKSLSPFVVRIWAHSAQLLEGLKDDARDSEVIESTKLADVLGDVTWYLANIASVYRLSLDRIAALNVDKTLSRWPGKNKQPTPLFDRHAPELEKLPRRLNVQIVPKDPHSSVMVINDVLVGDPLTDNSWEPDGYRFHDVLHLAHAGILGWSPVIRRMLKRKRKYDRLIDEVEDGARASIVEEAVTKLVHAYAQSVDPYSLLDNQTSVSFDILKRIKLLTCGLEVDRCKYWEWEKAILAGHKVFNELRRRGAGTIKVDLYERSIELVSTRRK